MLAMVTLVGSWAAIRVLNPTLVGTEGYPLRLLLLHGHVTCEASRRKAQGSGGRAAMAQCWIDLRYGPGRCSCMIQYLMFFTEDSALWLRYCRLQRYGYARVVAAR